jgi:alkylated DNA repair dioxygenase AlkB
MDTSYTFTCGDQGENHAGMQIIGEEAKEGVTAQDAVGIMERVWKTNRVCEIIDLKSRLPDNYKDLVPPTFVIIIRNLLTSEEANMLYEEQQALEWDNKYYDTRRKKVLNKRRRHNLMYSDESQEPDYENKKGRIVAWSDVPMLRQAVDILKELGGSKADNLVCEGNKYKRFEKKTNVGIGWHGDSERKKVFAIKCGHSMDLRYRWYHRRTIISAETNIKLNHGDAYIMSEWAVGKMWKSSSLVTIRHCAVPCGDVE